MHVLIATRDAAPFGLVVAINSTLAHAEAATAARLRFLVVVPSEMQQGISRKVGRIFPGRVSISVVAAPPALEKLGGRHSIA